MKSILGKIFTVCALVGTMAFNSWADNLSDLPVTKVGGRDCYYYEVQPKETVYSLCRRFGVSRDELLEHNPDAADGLKAGQRLYFPVDTENSTERPRTYVVEKKETAYGISKQFGLTTEEFYALNPEAVDGLKAGQTVKISKGTDVPVASASATTATEKTRLAPGMHEIAPHETLYQIARDNNTSVAAILAANPGLDERNYKAGQVISLGESQQPVKNEPSQPAFAETRTEEVKSVPESTPVVADVSTVTYRVHAHDTFYGIAGKFGITVSELQKVNPGVDMLREDMIINVPVKTQTSSLAENAATEASPQVADEGNSINATTTGNSDDNSVIDNKSVNIAVALPFMLNEENRSRQSQLYTEFYKGFLIAVDSLRNIGTPINIQTYDTEGTLAGVNRILSNPELKKANLIIAPDNQEHLSLFSNYGMVNDIDILNLFVVKSTDFNDNAKVLQANIPHEMMYGKAIDYLVKKFEGYVPVILTRTDGPVDKIEFTKSLASAFRGAGREVLEISFTGNLGEKDFTDLDRSKKYAFIPVTSKQAELNRMLPAIASFKEQTGGTGVVVWGYPEWTTFRGETLEGMHKVDAYVFSRFFTAPDDYTSRSIDDQFLRWYGARMAQYVPRQGLLGFDAGMYLIPALKANGGDFSRYTPQYTGVQNGFSFIRMPRGGLVNNCLFFLNYRPGTQAVSKITL